jgi:hypothetical protein
MSSGDEAPLFPCTACGALLDPPLLPAAPPPNHPNAPHSRTSHARPAHGAAGDEDEDDEEEDDDGPRGDPLALDFEVEGCDDACCCCGGGGELLLCDGCPAAFCGGCLSNLGALATAQVKKQGERGAPHTSATATWRRESWWKGRSSLCTLMSRGEL